MASLVLHEATIGAWSLRVVDAAAPLARPFRIAYTETRATESLYVLVDHGELVGVGEVTPVPAITGEHRDEALSRIRTTWPALALELNALGAPRTWEPKHLDVAIGNTVAKTDPAHRLDRSARSAVTCALADLAARARGVPLWAWYVGNDPRLQEQPVVASCLTVPLVDDDELEATVQAHLAAGTSALKVKTGLGIEQDLARLQTIRRLTGDHMALRVDANQGWSRPDVEANLEALASLGLEWLEQPLPRDDLEGSAQLVARGVVPIMLDESIFTPADARRALDAGAADLVNIKLSKCGGPFEAFRIADVATEKGVPCMLGCMIESAIAALHGAHVVAAHQNIRWADLDGPTFLAGDPVEGGPRLVQGSYQLDASPGIGARPAAS